MSTDDPDTDTDAADLEEAFPHVAKLEQELKEADIDIGDIDVAEILQQGGTTRRDLLAGGAGALGLGGLLTAASGTASAGNDQAGTVGSQAAPLDGYVEDLYDKNGNRVAELPGDGSLDVLQELSSQSVNTDEATIGNVVLDQSTIGAITAIAESQITVSSGAYQTIFSDPSAADIIGGVIVGTNIRELRITWSDDTTDEINPGELPRGADSAGDVISSTALPPIRDVKELEFRSFGTTSDYGWEVFFI
jgi:hypothetical protein